MSKSLSQTGFSPSGFQSADTHGVGTLERVPHTTIVSLLVVRLTASETKLIQHDRNSL